MTDPSAHRDAPETAPEPDRTDALREGSRRLLDRLSGLDWMHDYYLAGSAALALYLGHRRVRDLDLMGYRRLRSPERRDLLQDLLAVDGGVRVETARDGYFFLRFPKDGEHGGLGLRLFYYPYPLVGPEEDFGGVAVASALDLALMKLGAVISRGHRRDFLDLYLLCRRLPLGEVLERSVEKYGHVRDFPLQALKGLSDVASAREEPLPKLEIPCPWERVEEWLTGEVRELARRYVGLEGGETSGATAEVAP